MICREEFFHLTNQVTIAEYKDFVREYSEIDTVFSEAFALRFAKVRSNGSSSEYYKSYFYGLFEKYSERGYLDRQQYAHFSSDVQQVFFQAEKALLAGVDSLAFEIVAAALPVLVGLFEKTDDADDLHQECIQFAEAILVALSSKQGVSDSLKREVLDFIKTELKNPDYFNYGDYYSPLLHAAAIVSNELHLPHEYKELFDALHGRIDGLASL